MFLGSLILINSTTRPNSNTLWTNLMTSCSSTIHSSSMNVSLLWTNYTGYAINSVDISADGMYIVSGDFNRNVTFFNRTHGYLWNYTCGAGPGMVHDVSISSDGQYIVSGDSNGRVTLLARDGTYLGSYDTGANVTTVDISSNGYYIVAGTLGDEVLLFNTAGDVLNYMWKYNTGSNVWSVAISSGDNSPGEAFVSGGDNNFTLFTTMGGGMYFAHNDTVGDITSVAVSENAKFGIAGSSSSSVVCSYDFTNITFPVNPWWTYDTGTFPVTCVDTSREGYYSIFGNTNNITRVYGPDGAYTGHFSTGVVQSAKISKTGRYIVAGDNANNITYASPGALLWNYTTSAVISSVAISDNGLYFVAGDEGGYVYLGYNEVIAPLPDPLPLFLGLEMMVG
ncbi:MAG: WD40 repeat domain-containing protein, partial [Candidatus Hodarchaeota archaeon]